MDAKKSGYAVTSIDEPFFPALVALHHSIRRNSPGTKLACLTYGDDALAEKVAALGVEVLHNVEIGAYLPPGDGTEAGCSPMYARLLAPLLFGNCIWLDADQIVQRDLSELLALRFSEPLAAVPCQKVSNDRTVTGMPNAPGGVSIYSGLMVFNERVYNRLKITEQCLTLMNEARRDKIYYKFVVQSVLNVVIAGKFHHLDNRWQGFVTRSSVHPEEFYVLHWHGRSRKPWTHRGMANAPVWWRYYDEAISQ